MFWLGLFIALASIPGYTSATIPAGWAAMSIVLPLTLWRVSSWTTLHSLFLAFLAFIILSFAWTPNVLDGGFRLWQFVLMFLAFRLGSSLDDLTETINGLVIGCVISSLLSIAQHFGVNPVLVYSPGGESPGLFYNHSIQGQTLALVAIAGLCFGLWWQSLLLLPGIYLSGSRGGWLALALGLICAYFPKPKLLVIGIAIALFAVTYSVREGDIERIMIWKGVIANLAWPGQGIGSFNSLFIWTGSRLVHPEYTHNDSLHLLFEFGLGSAFLFAIIWASLTRPERDEFPIIATFVFLSFFAFPLFTPISTFLVALCTGRVSRCGVWSWDSLSDSRYAFTIRSRYTKLRASLPGRKAIPIQLRNP